MYLHSSVTTHQSVEKINNFLVKNIDTLYNLYPSFNLLILGDFNHFNTNALDVHFGLRNINYEPTRGNAILDLFLVDEDISDNFHLIKGPPIGESDHSSIFATPLTNFNGDTKISKTVFDFRDSHMNNLLYSLSNIDWSPVYNPTISIDEKCEIFYNKLNRTILSTIPRHQVFVSQKTKPWITPLTVHFVNKRWAAYRDQNFTLYAYYKEKVKKEIEKSKRIWSSRLNNSKSLWQKVHSVNGTKSSNPLNNILNKFSSIHEAVNAINESLCEVFTAPSIINNSPEITNWNIGTIHPTLVSKMLSLIPPNKACGSDLVPTIIYKKASDILSNPLTHIFNESVRLRSVPSLWKLSNVTPLPKCASPTIKDLRPISLLPIPSKILEKIVLTSIHDLLISHFGSRQHGFRPQGSTTTAMITMLDIITKYLDDKSVLGVQVIAYDFSKAFDKLNHKIIIDRLKQYSLPDGFINWCSNYLQNRKQRVIIGNMTSRTLSISSGVPQGSILGPALFAIVASTYESSHGEVVKFADDNTEIVPLYKNVDNVSIVLESFQNMTDWSTANHLLLNTSKTQSMTVSFSAVCPRIQIPGTSEVNHIKILGIYLSNNLSWDLHIDETCKTASKRLYALRVLRPILDKNDMIIVYYSLIRSLLEYASPCFVGINHRNSSKLDNIQRRAHIIICGPDCNCNQLHNLSFRRRQQATKLFLKAADNATHLLHNLIPRRQNNRTPRQTRFVQPYSSSSRRFCTFIPTVIYLINNNTIS